MGVCVCVRVYSYLYGDQKQEVYYTFGDQNPGHLHQFEAAVVQHVLIIQNQTERKKTHVKFTPAAAFHEKQNILKHLNFRLQFERRQS